MDLLAAARHFGHDQFLYFGYSFTGAFGPWLALKLQDYRAVRAVASGGFPLLGDYTITARDVNAQQADLEADPDLYSRLERRFDLRAGTAFYDDLATLAPDSLVDAISCPLYSFWGDHDEDAVGDGAAAFGISGRTYPPRCHLEGVRRLRPRGSDAKPQRCLARSRSLVARPSRHS
jgi:pimeloyl-ACP methyl ester carboxylesterase